MAKLRSPSGDLRAQRDTEAARFFGRKIKNAGSDGESSFTPMNKVQLARTDAQIGSLPSGGNTVGGCVGGLSDKGNYQGRKAGRS